MTGDADKPKIFLTKQQFSTISDYSSCSPHKLSDMLHEFKAPDGIYSKYVCSVDKTIDYEGFSMFLDAYFGANLPKDISDTLFRSFSTQKAALKEIGVTSEKSIPLEQRRISLKALLCWLSLLEDVSPEEKLEFVFHVYDADDDQSLSSGEVDSIIEQMLNVARCQQWDIVELEPVLRHMMTEIDRDSNGLIMLEEWKRVGTTTIPLLVLLGVETEIKEDGTHLWKLHKFGKPAYCHVCEEVLVAGKHKQGLACALCKFTAHERCVGRAPNSCIQTFSHSLNQPMLHHWIGSNRIKKCAKCRKKVLYFHGKQCRWCKRTLHNDCVTRWPEQCDLGRLATHILPPTSIVPTLPGQSALGLQAVAPSSSISRPVLVLINTKSGGQQGEKIYLKMLYLLNPRQVYDMKKDKPAVGLTFFSTIAPANVLACGGDGTVGWVLDSLDKIDYGEKRPSVAILPLGTGNDLARCLQWGGGYEGESLKKIIKSLEKAKTVMLDRWQLEVEPENENLTKESEKPPSLIINNYFSIGVDASIARRFHLLREKSPEKFNSRMRNKLQYVELFTSEVLWSTCKNLHETCDGDAIDLLKGKVLEGIAMLNIDSIYGGVDIWKGRKIAIARHLNQLVHRHPTSHQLGDRVQDISDGLFEVVGLQSAMHMGQIRIGIRTNARRLAQCSTLVIQTNKALPMQIDGEPWMQQPCTIRIAHKNKVPMLEGKIERCKWYLPKCCTVGD